MSFEASTGEAAAPVPANPFTRETAELGEAYVGAFRRVLESGWYILGKEVEAFEKELAAHLQGGEAVGCASGLDALMLALKACDVGEGHEVITTPLSAAATALAITHVGAKPVFVDVDAKTLALDPERVEAAVTSRTRAVVPVHLYGYPARARTLAEICSRKGLRLIEDCAQAIGTRAEGRTAGHWGDVGCFSFYPTKNLGAFGDAGAIVTRDPDLASRIRKLRNYGQRAKYEHVLAGYNSRLDEMQAALLRVKLEQLTKWTARRREIAALYDRALLDSPIWRLPPAAAESECTYHLYPVQVENREAALARFRAGRIEALIHYPTLIPEQECYRGILAKDPSVALPNAFRASRKLLSLPINPYLTDEECHRSVRTLLGGK